MRRLLLFSLNLWISLLIGIAQAEASSVHAGSSPIGSGKRVISSYSGGTSVQERAVEEPEDEQADPDGDRNSNFFEFAFGGDPLNHPDSPYLDVGTYDNWARVAIRERMSDAERLAYISANSSLEAEYVRGSDWGGGVGGILYTARGSVLSWAHYNGRGDVTVRSSATGALTYAASYEAYGTRTQEAGANADRQRANTKDEDPTGLLNEGMRYRDLETGLFITRDPMGFVDGPNVYTYVRQNPWSSFDPDGLFLETLWDIGNVIHDVGRAAINVGGGIGGVASYAYGAATGDRFLQEAAVDSLRNTASNLKESAIDFSVDIAATAIPFVPAGASKALRAADEIHDASKIADAAKLTDETVDLANSARKNVDEVAEGGTDAAKKTVPHRNSLDYEGDTHVYAVRNPDGTVNKIGESAQGVRTGDGASKRAEQQVRKLNRETGPGHTSEIRKEFSTKKDARKYETNLIERFRRRFGEDKLEGNKTNR